LTVPPFVSFCDWHVTLSITKGGFYPPSSLKLFLSTSTAGGLFTTKAADI